MLSDRRAKHPIVRRHLKSVGAHINHDEGRPPIRVYHRTNAAREILSAGFRDGRGYYLTQHIYEGVWVSAPHPLDPNEGACGETVLELAIPDSLFKKYEWVEDGKPHREALIPAKDLNTYLSTARTLSEQEADELTYGRMSVTEVSVRNRG